jgi:DNA-binding transcriptional MocR family regulator
VTTTPPRLSAAALARRLPPAPPGPAAYRALAARIAGAVLDGRIGVGVGLPSERALAGTVGLSRTTVAAAYTLLRTEGWLVSRRGSGSRVLIPRSESAPPLETGAIFGLRPAAGPAGADLIDLTVASLPAPAEPLAAAVAVAAAELTGHLDTDGYLPFGLPALRAVVAERYTADGLPTTPDQILITNGAQHSFTLALGELSAPGDRVLVECPTYPVALDAIRAARRIAAPVPVSAPEHAEANSERIAIRNLDRGAGQTWDLELLETTFRQTGPRLAYLMPDFQNPTGAVMTAPARERVVGAARRSGTMLVIDESFRDVPFPGEAALPPHAAAFDDGTRVVTVGSVSKSLWGGLRIGWIRAAPALIGRLAAARSLGDMAGPLLDQLVVAAMLADPDRALLEQRRRLAAGCAALSVALGEHLPAWVPTRPRGGCSVWVRLAGPIATELARQAPGVGVRIVPGPRFGPDGSMDSYLRLPFTAAIESLTAAVPRLAAAEAMIGTPATALPGWLA